METVLKNSHKLETPYGTRDFELHHGDMFNFPQPIDILVVSSFIGGYSPSPGTMLYYLKQIGGISLNELSKNPLIDLREDKHVWVSQRLHGKFVKYVICVELAGRDWKFRENEDKKKCISFCFENLFLVLQLLKTIDSSLTSAAMPILGSGNQKIMAEWILEPLFQHGKNFYNQKNALEHIYIVERNAEKVEETSVKMDEVLGRRPGKLTSIFLDEYSAELLLKIEKYLGYLMDVCTELQQNSTVFSLRQKIESGNVTYYDVSVSARKLLEYWIMRMPLDFTMANGLKFKVIQLDKSRLTPEWFAFYMHVIRTLGNSEVHTEEGISPPKYPMDITLEDQRVFLAVFLKFLRFWNKYAEEFREM